MPEPFDALPPDWRDLARFAVISALSRTQVDAVSPIAGGISALTYRVDAGGRAYVLRLEGPAGGLRDPRRSYGCWASAAEAGVAPPLRHADPDAGLAITDFIPPQPLDAYPGGPGALAADMGRLIGRLQATTPFPPFADFPVFLDRILAYVAAAGIFAPGLLDPHREALAQISAAYPWGRRPGVSSHNDPNPRNIIFDGERLWLIDWETAFRNDPLVDIAIVANELAPTAELAQALLHGWLGAAPDRRVEAQLLLMRRLTQVYYACLMLSPLAASPPAEPDASLAALSVDAFRAAIASGRLRVGDPQIPYLLAKMNLAGFLAGFATPAVRDALEIAQS